MGRGIRRGVQKKVIKLMSDGEVWSNTQLYIEVSKMKYGPDTWNSFHNLMGQLARFTPTRLSETHEIVKLENVRTFEDKKSARYTDYILQERQ